MKLFGKLLLVPALLVALTIAGYAAETFKPANPRTMTFPPLAFSIPTAERVVLSNGMRVYLLQDHDLPMVNMTAFINVGSIYEPDAKTGLAGMTGALIRSGGTRDMEPEKLDAELEFMASSIESSVGGDMGNLAMSTLTKNLDRTLELYAQVMMYPAFRVDRITIARNRAIEAVRRQNDDPKEVADRELTKALYAGHPFGRYPTMDSLNAITRDDLATFYKRYYQPENIILAVSGDFDKKQLLARLESLFGGWKGKAELPQVAAPAPEVKPEVLFVRKDVNQSAVRMGHMGVDKSNPDIYAIRVMDYILGGGFTSRLVQEVRSNQGLAYNVDSHFDIGRRFIGTFVAETETKSRTTVKAISLMRDIIAGLTKEPVTDQELSLAKDSMINSFIFGFAKPEAVVAQRARLEFYGYPEGYLEKYRDNIAKVTKDDVLRVAKKYLHPDKMVITVVGDDKGFDKPLSVLGPVREIKLENGK